jgi:methyl coenzyme M reductase subunit D
MSRRYSGVFFTTLLGRAAVRGFEKTNQRYNHLGPIKSIIRVAVHGRYLPH